MKIKLVVWMCLSLISVRGLGQTLSQEEFNFEYQGVTLNGILDLPKGEVKGLIMIVHGSGRTRAVGGNMHGDVRRTMVEVGYGTYMWDKMGCGKSGGSFDNNQSVQSSAEEVMGVGMVRWVS